MITLLIVISASCILLVPSICRGVRAIDIKCRLNLLAISDGLGRYFETNKYYPQQIEEIKQYLLERGLNAELIFKCPADKDKVNKIDYEYFSISRADATETTVLVYEKQNNHYIGWWAFGLKAYNARHVLISDGKNKDIKLYSDDDFKVLLDKHQRKPDKENK